MLISLEQREAAEEIEALNGRRTNLQAKHTPEEYAAMEAELVRLTDQYAARFVPADSPCTIRYAPRDTGVAGWTDRFHIYFREDQRVTHVAMYFSWALFFLAMSNACPEIERAQLDREDAYDESADPDGRIAEQVSQQYRAELEAAWPDARYYETWNRHHPWHPYRWYQLRILGMSDAEIDARRSA